MSPLSPEALREFQSDVPGQRTVEGCLSSRCLAIKALQLSSFGYETLNLAQDVSAFYEIFPFFFLGRMFVRRSFLFSGGHVAPRSGGALRRHALRPVPV